MIEFAASYLPHPFSIYHVYYGNYDLCNWCTLLSPFSENQGLLGHKKQGDAKISKADALRRVRFPYALPVDNKEVTKPLSPQCHHARAYFDSERDNFLCWHCRKSMGLSFYEAHKSRIQESFYRGLYLVINEDREYLVPDLRGFVDAVRWLCTHKVVYFSHEHDNFYCSMCHAGMGQEFYDAHRAKIGAYSPGSTVTLVNDMGTRWRGLSVSEQRTFHDWAYRRTGKAPSLQPDHL